MKSKLTTAFNNVAEMLSVYKECKFEIREGTIDNAARSLVDNYVKNSKKYPKEKVVYLEEEEKTLPEGMFESYTKLCIVIEAVGDKYMLEMERRGILENYKKLFYAFESYKKFFEKEIIMTAKEV